MSFPRYERYKDSGMEWLGEVPEHWDLMRLILMASINDGALDEDTSPDFEMEYVDISSVTPGSKRLAAESMKYGGAPSRARRIVKDRDILVSTVRTYLRAIAPVIDPPANLIASTGFAVIRPREHCSHVFLNYSLQAASFIEEVIARSTGVSYPAINAHELAFIKLPLPPLKQEQERIGLFLETETSKIDALIEEQRRLIELLKEKRQAVISHAVTKGLKPDALMKDSGIELLGNVPAEWTPMTVTRIINRIEQGWSPDCFARQADTDGWGVVKSGCVNRGVFAETENKALPPELDPNPEYEIQPGNVLMSRASGSPELVGSTALVTQTRPRLMLSDKIFRIHLDESIRKEFFVALLNSTVMRSQIKRAISGAGGLANNLPQSALKTFWFALPPTCEQEVIAVFIAEQTGTVDMLLDEAELSIELLEERRSALISSAVTGKIDVRNYMPKEAA